MSDVYLSRAEALALFDNINQKLSSMEVFFKRRFDEVSTEINATSTQLDMAEESIAGQFSEIIKVLISISNSAGGITAANSGMELEAVISDTEKAANTILDAADRIAERIHSNENNKAVWGNETEREALIAATKSDVQEILMACSFQDLTGQRIRKTLDNLAMIERRLSSTLKKVGIEISLDSEEVMAEKTANLARSQSDIDALFR